MIVWFENVAAKRLERHSMSRQLFVEAKAGPEGECWYDEEPAVPKGYSELDCATGAFRQKIANGWDAERASQYTILGDRLDRIHPRA